MTAPAEQLMSGSAARRKLLQASVSCLCNESSFGVVEEMALETLTEMIQSFITELGQSSRQYCELSGRVEPVVGDVVMALVSMGINHTSLELYAKRPKRLVLSTPTQATLTKPTGILQTGQKRPHPSHIPDHLPSFPDSHAYVQTPTHKQPITDYESIREKAACQKRDVERALTRFVAKTGETQSFFLTEDTSYFPLIACKPLEKPYHSALLPKDQIFEDDEAAVHMQKQEEANAEAIKAAKLDQEKENSETIEGQNNSLNESTTEPFMLENPFLRPVKMPFLKKKNSP